MSRAAQPEQVPNDDLGIQAGARRRILLPRHGKRPNARRPVCEARFPGREEWAAQVKWDPRARPPRTLPRSCRHLTVGSLGPVERGSGVRAAGFAAGDM